MYIIHGVKKDKDGNIITTHETALTLNEAMALKEKRYNEGFYMNAIYKI